MICDHQQALTAAIHSSGEQAKLPLIIDVQEDSRILDIVLRRCYTAHVPRLETLSDARLVLAAALKYNIDVVRAHAAAALTELAEQDVIAAWSIALHYRLRDVCVVAARRTLQHHYISLNSAELRYIPASQYHALLQYQKRCGAAAAAVVLSRTWFEEGMSLSYAPSRSQQCCACCVPDSSGNSGWYAPSPFWKFLEAARAALEAPPYSLLVLSDDVMGKWRPPRCSYNCVSSRKSGRDIKFARAFMSEVDRVIAEMRIRFVAALFGRVAYLYLTFAFGSPFGGITHLLLRTSGNSATIVNVSA